MPINKIMLIALVGLAMLFTLFFFDNSKPTPTVEHTETVRHVLGKATSPGVLTTAVYFEIVNTDEIDWVLIGGNTDIAENVEIHEHALIDGLTQMRKIDSITIKKQSSLLFEPGGYHIMLIGLKKQLRSDEKINLSLQFQNREQEDLIVDIVDKISEKDLNHELHHY
ncbi:MAG: copper chaperone PCu(A)C [Pseudomonadota bacterium]